MANNAVAPFPLQAAGLPVTAATGYGLPRVVVLMADAGGGHRSAARSLAEVLEGRAHVNVLNLLDECTPFPFNRFSASYAPWVNYAPGLYSLVYRATESRKPVEIGEHSVYPLVRRRLADALVAARPDIVISVHPLLTGVPLRVLREAGNQAPFITVVTDPVTAHPAWFCPEVDLCVVATTEARDLAIAHGMDAERVRIIGLPVRRSFATPREQPKAVQRAALGLDPDRQLILMTGGGAGIGKVIPMARAIAKSLGRANLPVQMAIIAGRNAELLRRLHKTRWPIPVRPLGFIDAMADWLAASDVLISKAGPGTLAEAACLGVPVLVTGYIPGQEEGNIAWVEHNGAGAFVAKPAQVADIVTDWLRPGNPALGRMAERAVAVARPDAAMEIAHLALGLWQNSARLLAV